jgi:3',5'-cyclic AMP phosphodiesterase CpdA
MTRILVLSDLHLSPTHGFFWDNWTVARDTANAMAPAAVVVNGDLCINGPDSDAEVGFAANALAQLAPRVQALPGNHDVGDDPPGQDADQLIDAARLSRWNAAFGTDRWLLDLRSWRLIGVNAQLFGSGLESETTQEAWLHAALAGAADRQVALFLHKPLFIEHPDEAEVTTMSLNLAPRQALLAKLRTARVPLVVSGHLHQYRDRMIGEIRHLWAPSTAFMASHALGGDRRPGMLAIDFAGDQPSIELVRPAGMAELDLATIKGHGRYKFLRDMPACPPQTA